MSLRNVPGSEYEVSAACLCQPRRAGEPASIEPVSAGLFTCKTRPPRVTAQKLRATQVGAEEARSSGRNLLESRAAEIRFRQLDAIEIEFG